MPVLSDVYFFYTNIKTPKLKWDSKTEKEYQTTAVMDKKSAREWNKNYPAFKVKVLTKEEFESGYKMEPPFEEGDQVFVRGFSTNYTINGEPVTGKIRPRVYVRGDKANTVKDVTETCLVGNGSFGDIEFVELKNKSSCKLRNILVKNMIEYNPDTVFGKVEEEYEGDKEESEIVKPQQEAKKPASKKAKEDVAEYEDDFEDDIPF